MDKQEYQKEYHKQWYQKNKDKANAASRAYTQNNYEKIRNNKLLRKFGITLEQYKQMLDKQDGGCKICQIKDPGQRDFAVDHDHKTNKIRGLLCGPCNTLLGLAKEKVDTLSKAIEYLKDTTYAI